jgi:cation transport ATPase
MMAENTRERLSHEAAYQAFQFVVCFVFTAPLVAHWVAMWLGWRVFFLADPRIQIVWATILQLAGAWPFYAGARRGQGARRSADLAVAAATTGLYLYGADLTFWRPAVTSHPYFQVQATVITLVTLDRLISVLIRRRRIMRST